MNLKSKGYLVFFDMTGTLDPACVLGAGGGSSLALLGAGETIRLLNPILLVPSAPVIPLALILGGCSFILKNGFDEFLVGEEHVV